MNKTKKEDKVSKEVIKASEIHMDETIYKTSKMGQTCQERKKNPEEKLERKRFCSRCLWILLCYPIGIFCLILAKSNRFIAEEIFAKRVFSVLSQTISFFTGLLPFSIAELFLVLGIPFLFIFIFIRICYLVLKNKMTKKRVLFGFRTVILSIGVLFLLFVLGCGVNYYRYPFSYYSELEVKETPKEELYLLCAELAERTNEAREMLTTECEDENGVYQYKNTIKTLGKAAQQAYITLAEEYPVFSGNYPTPKPVFFSKMMSKAQITGIFIPFTMEANVNIDISDYAVASTMCHELAHLHGFIREDEANYISYLACTKSGNLDLVYSGLIEALIVSGNALYEKDRELYYQVCAMYSEAVKRDLYANSVYWKKFENTVISNAADKVNDVYLKINDQEDGVQSYGRMVDLLLAEYRKNHFTSSKNSPA